MPFQTRQEYFDECEANGDPLPELIKPGKGVGSEDVNTTDIRYISDDGETVGPWRKTKEEAEADAES